jgi:hypothetical protein
VLPGAASGDSTFATHSGGLLEVFDTLNCGYDAFIDVIEWRDSGDTVSTNNCVSLGTRVMIEPEF